MRKIGLVLILALSSCTTENEYMDVLQQDVERITVSIEGLIPADGESRVFRDDEGNFLWEMNDSLGVFPTLGGQVGFGVDENDVGTIKASIDGGGWALKNSYTYSAYYPYNFYNRNVNAVPMSYVGLVQDGNDSKTHLSDKLFMASPPITVIDGSLTFRMSHRGTVTELALTLPEVATYTSVDMYTSEAILPVQVTFDLQSEQLTQTNIKCSDHYSLKLDNVKTTEANEIVTVWFVTPSIIDKSKTLWVVVKDSKGNNYVADIITSKGASATVNFPAKSKRTLNASPVLTDGLVGGIEDWVTDGQEYSGVAE